MTTEYKKLVRPLVILFVVLNAVLLSLQGRLARSGIDGTVVICANLLLFFAALLNIYFQWKNVNNPNPNAIIRGVMAAMLLKLFVLAAAVLIYLITAGESRSVNAVFVGMALYIVYTWLEVRISLRLNPKK